MRRVAPLCVALLAACVLVGQGTERAPPDLEVRSLTVKDKDGIARARLGAEPIHGSPYLIFWDKKGKGRVKLDMQTDGSPYLSFWDKDGGLRAVVGALADGSPYLRFRDKDARSRASLETNADGSPSLTFYAPKRKVIWKAPKD
jgi:hypothetical protein